MPERRGAFVRTVHVVVLPVLLAFAAGCRRDDPRAELRVFAASSLVDVFNEAGARFEADHPDIDFVLSVAGSQILASQILEGARADVFASADRSQMDRVADLFPDPVVFAENRVVLITPAGSDITTPDDLARPGVRLVLASEAVPAGRYARVVLDRQGLLDRVTVVSLEPDVRAVLTRVAMAEADAGLVYATDAASTDKVRTIALAPEAEVRAAYVIAPGRDAPAPARAFVAFMRTGAGAEILRRHGFLTPAPP